ncbi:MAG: 16S rRNA (cytosine(967)-C(5))-methyltransferase [Gammaproteobacteria bacterium GWE2_42_36]|nr:MAG: 16S rRNA (cytosine(967)-C(5))-methyltransferase [Gammaproteobacteria bacterium GWE2_42_36]HCU05084.1 16S rRNA (cytosine(967)-C(5))-methyltransferase [Coxiellaceae bacterium]
MKKNSRAIAARILGELWANQFSFSKTFPLYLTQAYSLSEKAFIKEICYGVARFYETLETISAALLKKPLSEKDPDIHALILVGLYQLIYMRTPDYAAIGETVESARILRKEWACKLINAVLRNFIRQKEALLALGLNQDNHPAWFVDRLKKAYPNDWKVMLEANQQHPPMSLRVNQRKISRENYLQRLRGMDLGAEISSVSSGLVLKNPVSVSALPGFLEGEVSVQDISAQLAAELMELEAGQSVLDACAAPGGKLCHLLEKEPQLKKVVAIDQESHRMHLIEENLTRLNLKAQVICADASKPVLWWDRTPFDRILLDAPCSATGVIRRHPEIKLLRHAGDIAQNAVLQLALLQALWPLLKSNGKLLYVTCSILPQENDEVIQAFLKDRADAIVEPFIASWGIQTCFGRQVLTGQNNSDGFYYARIKKAY